jgi:hypothetical protein
MRLFSSTLMTSLPSVFAINVAFLLSLLLIFANDCCFLDCTVAYCLARLSSYRPDEDVGKIDNVMTTRPSVQSRIDNHDGLVGFDDVNGIDGVPSPYMLAC